MQIRSNANYWYVHDDSLPFNFKDKSNSMFFPGIKEINRQQKGITQILSKLKTCASKDVQMFNLLKSEIQTYKEIV